MRNAVLALMLIAIIGGAALAQDRTPRPFTLDDDRENLALGKPYLYSAVPSYRLTANETDLQDLTDGLITWHAADKIWFDANAVAWHGDVTVDIQVDLGEVAAIDEIGIRLLGGAEQGGLKFPDEVVALVSDDAREWREVGRFDRLSAEDLQRFGVPPEEGVAYTYPLRFQGLQAAGRYVGYAIRGQTSFIASDELWVFAGDFDVADADRGVPYQGDFLVHNFTPGGVTAFFPKPRVYACENLQSFQTMHGYDNRPEETNGKACELVVDLPEGVTLRRFLLNPRFGGTVVDDFETEPVSDDGGDFTRYYVATRGVYITSWGTIFLQTTQPDGWTGTMRLGCRWDGGMQEPEPYTVEAVHIDPVDPPELLHISMAWMTQMFWQKWPDFIDSYRSCGFSAVPVFPRYAQEDDAELFAAIQACRDAGLEIASNSSPLHGVWGQRSEFPEVACQLPDGPARWLCPSYRGELWQQEVANVARRYSWTQAEWLLYDCEVFSSWFGPAGGNDGARECSRCQAAFAAFGGEWDDFVAHQGAEFYRAVHARISELVPDASFTAGAYGVEPSEFYHEIWDWATLYPELHQFAMPSMYGFRPAAIGDEVRRNRELIEHSDIIPWLQPGDLGEMDAETLRCILLEVLLGGGRGAAYYTSAGFDAADMRAVSDVVAMLTPVEETIVNGRLLPGGASDVESVRLSAIEDGEQAVLLVAEYVTPGPVQAMVTLPAGVGEPVYELTAYGSQPIEVRDGAIAVSLDEVRARAFRATINE